jgi:hypothetical protein
LAVNQAGQVLPPTVIVKSQSKAAKEAPGNTRTKIGDVYQYKQVNKTMTSHIMVDYIRNVLSPCYSINERKLLIMDCAPGHKTDQVKRACRELNFDICMIPGWND